MTAIAAFVGGVAGAFAGGLIGGDWGIIAGAFAGGNTAALAAAVMVAWLRHRDALNAADWGIR